MGLQGIERESYCWLTHPKEGDIHSKMRSLGRVDPFEVGYACRSIPDHQPEGRAPNQPLSCVWQSAKVLDHAINKVVYIGYEHPSGREQLLTTEGWKLSCRRTRSPGTQKKRSSRRRSSWMRI